MSRLFFCQVISVRGGLNLLALTLDWVLLLFEDLQGTSNFRFLVGTCASCLG